MYDLASAGTLTLYLIENTFANRADPDQAALVDDSVCLWQYDISDPIQVDLTSNFFTNIKVYLIIHRGWSLA